MLLTNNGILHRYGEAHHQNELPSPHLVRSGPLKLELSGLPSVWRNLRFRGEKAPMNDLRALGNVG